MGAGVALAEDVLGGQLVGLGHLGSVPAPARAQLLGQSLVALQIGLRRLPGQCGPQTLDERGGGCLPAGRTEPNDMLCRGCFDVSKDLKWSQNDSTSDRQGTLRSSGARSRYQAAVSAQISVSIHAQARGSAGTCWKKALRMRMWSRASRRAPLYCASAPAPVITQGASLCGLLRPLGAFLAAAALSCTPKAFHWAC